MIVVDPCAGMGTIPRVASELGGPWFGLGGEKDQLAAATAGASQGAAQPKPGDVLYGAGQNATNAPQKSPFFPSVEPLSLFLRPPRPFRPEPAAPLLG